MSSDNLSRKAIPLKKDLQEHVPAPEDPNSLETLFAFYHSELMKEEAREAELKEKLAEELKKLENLTKSNNSGE